MTTPALPVMPMGQGGQTDPNDARWNVVAEASRVFAEASLDLQHVLDTVTRHIAELHGDLCVIRLLSEDGDWLVPVSKYHPNSEALELLGGMLGPASQRSGEGFHGQVVGTNAPLLIPYIAPDAIRAATQPGWYQYLDRFGITSILIVPLRARGRVLGSLGVFRGDRDNPYTVDDQILFQDLADRAALAIDNTRLYEQLVEREHRLQDLVGRLLTAQEEERRRVAYDIHDGLAQIAAGAHQHLQAFAHHYRPRSEQARAELARALELSRRTIREARRVIGNLRPTALDDFGLAIAIRLLVEDLNADGWSISYHNNLDDDRLPSAVETALFRVVQETLTNVRKHAGTTKVEIVIERHGMTVHLELTDNGRGFDPGTVVSGEGAGERVGLAGMRERIGLLGGTFRLDSRPNAGTRISAVVPLFLTTGDDGAS